jgi:hypothetical protein
MTSSIKIRFALLLALTGAGSCGINCTLIGCESGLGVNFGEAVLPPGGQVTATSSGQERTFTCPEAGRCTGAMFRDFTPAQVQITVRYGETVQTQSFSPSYRTTRPNGDNCDPECTYAEVAMSL